MKSIISFLISLYFFTTLSSAEPFVPTPLEISVQDHIAYDFDGTEVDIPVNVAGKPARAWLWINTRLDDEDKPSDLRNGHRGWHYVDGIDTTVYISRAKEFTIGLVRVSLGMVWGLRTMPGNMAVILNKPDNWSLPEPTTITYLLTMIKAPG